MKRLFQHKGGLDEMHEYNFDDQITSCQYSIDGSHLAIGDDSGRVVIFDSDKISGELSYLCEVHHYLCRLKLTRSAKTGAIKRRLNQAFSRYNGCQDLATAWDWLVLATDLLSFGESMRFIKNKSLMVKN
jgi:hypothetical protein